MKAIMEFSLPEENEEHLDAINGSRWKQAMLELDKVYRGIIKYGDDPDEADRAEKVREKIREICGDWGLNLDA